MERVARVGLQLEVPGADPEEVAELTLQLREELLQLDIESADLVTAENVPAGAKAGEALALGALLVSLASSAPALLGAVVKAVESWVGRMGHRSVKLELDGDVLEVTGVSSRQQQDLIQAWLARLGDR
ncbi:MAG: hypothetical protein M3198_20370 [Actinomycetota bacterium]|nr:hypothetical protein [Actinomycetota bacterium]